MAKNLNATKKGKPVDKEHGMKKTDLKNKRPDQPPCADYMSKDVGK